jgi:hypothetical protein
LYLLKIVIGAAEEAEAAERYGEILTQIYHVHLKNVVVLHLERLAHTHYLHL